MILLAFRMHGRKSTALLLTSVLITAISLPVLISYHYSQYGRICCSEGIQIISYIFFDFIGRLKLATVLLGLLNVILVGTSYVHHDSRDQAFLAIVIICFLLSLAWVVAIMFGLITVEDSHIKFDMIFHICACILLLISGVFFMVSVIKYGSKASKLGVRICAMIVGFVNCAIYGYLPWKLLKAT